MTIEAIAGVDIGGTKTRLVVASVRGLTPASRLDVTVPTASWRDTSHTAQTDAAALSALLIEHAGVAVTRAAWVVGAHGCDNTRQCREFESALRGAVSGPVRVVNDSELMAPAAGVADAIGVVVGTGSIATARTPEGELVTAGGWGWMLGDEGSAPGLVREALRAVLTDLDRGGRADVLAERLFEAFDARDGAELAAAASHPAVADTWGQHAPELFRAAQEGSVLAERVIHDAGDALAGLVASLIARGVPARSVVAGGSVIERQPRLQNALRSALAATHPELTLTILDQAPVEGAVALARALASRTSSETEI